MYDVVIFTNRNYGLYSAYALSILGLKVVVLNIVGYKENKTPMEPHIWPNEQKEEYLYILNTRNISIMDVNYKDVFYNYNSELWHVKFFNNSKLFCSKNLLFALSKNHLIGGAHRVKLEDFQFKNGLYIIGENAIYNGKIYEGDIYTGEANLVAQQIYKKIHNCIENITIHSTEVYI